MTKYQIIEYDVWGNAKEGYEINNFFRTGRTVKVRKEGNRALFEALKRAGVIKVGIRLKSVGFEHHEHGVYVTDERRPRSYDFGWGRPELSLEKIEDDLTDE